MNDYLAKPVKAKTLESMLLKWVRRRKARLGESLSLGPAELESVCTDPEISSQKSITSHRPVGTPEDREPTGVMSISDNSPWLGCEGDRDMQRCEAEEKATSLRDDKLLAASSGQSFARTHLSPSRRTTIRPGSPTPALTEENISMLDREQDGSPLSNSRFLRKEHSSLRAESRDSSPPSSTVGSLHSATNQGKLMSSSSAAAGTRGRLNRNDSDRSQVTVTASKAGR